MRLFLEKLTRECSTSRHFQKGWDGLSQEGPALLINVPVFLYFSSKLMEGQWGLLKNFPHIWMSKEEMWGVLATLLNPKTYNYSLFYLEGILDMCWYSYRVGDQSQRPSSIPSRLLICLWPWASHLTSLSFTFLFCKMVVLQGYTNSNEVMNGDSAV